MKRPGVLALSMLSLVILIVGCAPGVAPAQTEGAGLWEVVLQVDVQPPTIAAEFLDQSFGIMVGDSSQLTYTTDGARTWQTVSRLPYSGHIEFISFPDAHTGWAASAESSRLWATADGGQTWVETPSPPEQGEWLRLRSGRPVTGTCWIKPVSCTSPRMAARHGPPRR